MAPLEIEVKFFIRHPDTARANIESIGAGFTGKTREENIRFEDKDCSLIANKSLLRLRKTDSHYLLTYKGEPPEADDQYKVHREYEVAVSDFDTMCILLEALGYHPAQRYEKIRETYEIEGALLCLDRMPYGTFLEIEGKPNVIRETANRLGLNWKERILENYLSIFERLKKELNMDFNDVTFENFRDVRLDFSNYLHWFMAG